MDRRLLSPGRERLRLVTDRPVAEVAPLPGSSTPLRTRGRVGAELLEACPARPPRCGQTTGRGGAMMRGIQELASRYTRYSTEGPGRRRPSPMNIVWLTQAYRSSPVSSRG